MADELTEAREAYIRLDKQMQAEKAELRSQTLLGVWLDIQEPCQDMAPVLRMALDGQRTIEDVTRFWNRLTEALGRALESDHVATIKPE